MNWAFAYTLFNKQVVDQYATMSLLHSGAGFGEFFRQLRLAVLMPWSGLDGRGETG